MSEQSKSPEQESPYRSRSSERCEEIAFRAVDMAQFQRLVQEAQSKLEAIRVVREELRKIFPEIEDLPEPQVGVSQRPIGGLASNEFRIAKMVVDLLREK